MVFNKQLSLVEGENRLNIEELSGLESGIYFVSLQNSFGALRQKVVKE
jgi:hypothetical protein